LVYIISLFSFGLIALFDAFPAQENRRYVSPFLLTTTIIFLTTISVLRFWTGYDYGTYSQIIDGIATFGHGWYDAIAPVYGEWGFKILVSFLRTIGLSTPAVFGIIAASCVLLNYVVFRTFGRGASIAFAVYLAFYFFGREMGQLRQAIATALVVAAVSRFLADDFRGFILLVLVAVSMHVTAITILLLVPASRIRLSPSLYLAVAVVATAVSAFFHPLSLLVQTVPQYLGKITLYATDPVFLRDIPLWSFAILRRLAPVILAALLLARSSDDDEQRKRFAVIANLVLIGFVGAVMTRDVPLVSERMFMYFTFFETVVYGKWVIAADTPDRRFWRLAVIVAIMVLYVYNNLFVVGRRFYQPYETWLFHPYL